MGLLKRQPEKIPVGEPVRTIDQKEAIAVLLFNQLVGIFTLGHLPSLSKSTLTCAFSVMKSGGGFGRDEYGTLALSGSPQLEESESKATDIT